MKEEFDFNRIGKRMPYTAPEGFLDEMEKNVWERARDEAKPKPGQKRRLLYWSFGAIAASVAALFAFNFFSGSRDADGLTKIEQAFSELNNADQAYLLTVYEEDLFINE